MRYSLTFPSLLGALLLLPVVWAAGGNAHAADATARVEAFSPEGYVRHVRQVVVRFSDSMVALGDPRLTDPFTVSCAARGKGRWADTRDWVFDFDADVDAGVRCRFTLRAGLNSIAGAALAGRRSFSFETGGPAIMGSLPREGWEEIDEEQVFLLCLDAPARPGSVAAHAYCAVDGLAERVPVRVLTGAQRQRILAERGALGYDYFWLLFKGGAAADVRVRDRAMERRESLLTVLQCERRLPPGTRVLLHWGAGIASLSGIATREDQQLAFRVRPAFIAQVECTRTNPRAGCVPMQSIAVAFSAPVPRGWALGRSVGGAARDELIHRHRRGASTITMQLATLLRGRRAAGGWEEWLEKVQQARMALSLERSWTKPEILEAYLNLLGYKGELQGIGAAAAQLAGKTPSGLSVPESVVLAALLPDPAAAPQKVVARACARGRRLRPAADCAAIGEAAHEMLASDAVLASDSLAPQLASERLKRPGERLRTSIDARIQRFTRDIVRSHISALSDHNVRDGAALVVDNATGEVLAYVSSAAPDSRAAEVDGVLAPRQAGSTLKPFLYEMALERRYITAASLLADSSLSLETASGVYIPQDYDHDFKGLVSVRTALASSLNVPAVRTLVLTGVEAFRDRLNALGYNGIKREGNYYGYSLALGSAEVTVWQQAQAYRTLARGGDWSPLTLTPTGAPTAPRRLLAPGATFVVGDILADPAARTVTFGLDSHLDTNFWTAVKTGTSEDMRDNWCIGFSRHFTIAVWVGNYEGDSMRDVSGVSGAAPIWHDIMAALHRGVVSVEPAPPPGVSVELTSFSPPVEPPRREWFLSGTTPASARVAVVPPTVRPSIQSPANGMIIAIDPDIPAGHQKVLIAVRGARPGMKLMLNDRSLGPAVRDRLWQPSPGAYYLTLEDESGRQLDRVLFRVRGLTQ
jgi:penicillin-binding protein 1C